MELDQIHAFRAVARHGSFSLAAQELLITQPAVSIKIRKLELELGHRLIERRQRRVALTPAGEVLLRRAESILGEIAGLATELADLSERRTGRVSLGASDTVSLYLLPQVVKRFSKHYPGIELKLFTQVSRQVLDRIFAGEIDIGIVTLPVGADGIEARTLYEDEFVVVFPPDHALGRKRVLRPDDLRGHPIIHLKPDTFTRRWIDGKLEPFGLRGQVRMEVSTIEVIKRLVEVGLGISLLPKIALAEELRSGRLRFAALEAVPLTRPMGLAHRKGKYLSLAVQAFIDDLEAHAATLETREKK